MRRMPNSRVFFFKADSSCIAKYFGFFCPNIQQKHPCKRPFSYRPTEKNLSTILSVPQSYYNEWVWSIASNWLRFDRREYDSIEITCRKILTVARNYFVECARSHIQHMRYTSEDAIEIEREREIRSYNSLPRGIRARNIEIFRRGPTNRRRASLRHWISFDLPNFLVSIDSMYWISSVGNRKMVCVKQIRHDRGKYDKSTDKTTDNRDRHTKRFYADKYRQHNK